MTPVELLRLTDAVRELFYWQVCDPSERPTWFHHRLYTLISASDPANRRKLALGFPWEVEAFKLWEAAEDEWMFFRAFGFERKIETVV